MLDIGERMRNKNFSPVHAQVVEVVKIRLVNNKSLYTPSQMQVELYRGATRVLTIILTRRRVVCQ